MHGFLNKTTTKTGYFLKVSFNARFIFKISLIFMKLTNFQDFRHQITTRVWDKSWSRKLVVGNQFIES